MIRIVIIDDEDSAVHTIEKIILLSDEDVEVLGVAKSVKEAKMLINSTSPDLVLLDIELQDGTGFDLLEELENIRFKVIFITASDEYALKAFRYSALDYIVKPIDPDDLIKSLSRIDKNDSIVNIELQMKVLIENFNKINDNAKTTCPLILKTCDAIHVVNINEIVRCESYRNYTTFYIDSGEKILVSNTLKEYEKLLPEKCFLRVHNSHLINISKIRKYEKHNSGYLIMTDNSRVPVSQRKRDILFNCLDKMMKL
ncbi:MAG: LytTR family DNA-binding domain-containing protein [Bacteroidales bacterium]|nr:LytTR family DNA-binding domain-containing protein [Bacteroidales bacterium]